MRVSYCECSQRNIRASGALAASYRRTRRYRAHSRRCLYRGAASVGGRSLRRPAKRSTISCRPCGNTVCGRRWLYQLRTLIPSLVSQSARTRPVGPAPMIRTSLCIISSSVHKLHSPGRAAGPQFPATIHRMAGSRRVAARAQIQFDRTLVEVPAGVPFCRSTRQETKPQRLSRASVGHEVPCGRTSASARRAT